MQYQTLPKPGPNEELVFIERPGYYIIPKKPTSSTRTKAKSNSRKRKARKSNPFNVDLQAWHLVLLLIAAALMAISIVFG